MKDRGRKCARLVAVCIIANAGFAPAFASSTPNASCLVGSYRLSSGASIDVAPADGNTLRWRLFTGETGQLHRQNGGGWTSTLGWTGRPDGKKIAFSSCKNGEIFFGEEKGRRVKFDTINTAFMSGGVKLVGRLVMPRGNEKVAVVVLIHGSEHDSARVFNSLQRMLPAQGIGAFVYDKRGTGGSGGEYTQDFETLANDAVYAIQRARRLAGVRVARIGYQGGSAGGWVAPLAAGKAHADFTVVSFGLAVTVLEEDQESVELDMRFHHHESDTAKALELARSGEHVFETGGREGYEEFDAIRQKYKDEPWYQDVHGDFLFFILPLDKAAIVEAMRKFAFHTPFRYEPMPTLRNSTTPQLWALGSDDLEAPSEETSKRIESLIAAGKDITLSVFPMTEHGMTAYELDEKGNRVSTRFVPGYFQMIADFIRDGHIREQYGDAKIVQPHVQPGLD